jgi:hypothetical protein
MAKMDPRFDQILYQYGSQRELLHKGTPAFGEKGQARFPADVGIADPVKWFAITALDRSKQ